MNGENLKCIAVRCMFHVEQFMGKTLFAPIQWEQIKLAIVAGAAWDLVMQQFPGLTYETIKKRAQRGGWPLVGVPKHKSVSGVVPKSRSIPNTDGLDYVPKSVPDAGGHGLTEGQTAKFLIAGTDNSTALGCLSRLVPRVAEMIDRAQLVEIQSVKDLEAYVRILKSAALLDNTSVNLDLSFSVGPHGRQNPLRVYDAQTGQPVSDTPSDGNNG